MESIPTLTCTELFIQRIRSVSTEQTQIGVKSSLEQILGARKTPREIQMKREKLKSFVDIPKLPPASGNRMLQNMESFESMPPRSQIESLRTTAGFHHPVEKVSICTTALHKEDGWRKCTSLYKENTKPRNDEDLETVCFN